MEHSENMSKHAFYLHLLPFENNNKNGTILSAKDAALTAGPAHFRKLCPDMAVTSIFWKEQMLYFHCISVSMSACGVSRGRKLFKGVDHVHTSSRRTVAPGK